MTIPWTRTTSYKGETVTLSKSGGCEVSTKLQLPTSELYRKSGSGITPTSATWLEAEVWVNATDFKIAGNVVFIRVLLFECHVIMDYSFTGIFSAPTSNLMYNFSFYEKMNSILDSGELVFQTR